MSKRWYRCFRRPFIFSGRVIRSSMSERSNKISRYTVVCLVCVVDRPKTVTFQMLGEFFFTVHVEMFWNRKTIQEDKINVTEIRDFL